MSDTENAEQAESEVFDPFTAATPTKTVVLAAPYTAADGTEHKADKKIDLDRDEADRLLHAGLARTVELDDQLRAEAAASEAKSAGKPATVKDILAAVGDDPAKAAAALATEKTGENRPTLVSKLEAIVNNNQEGA